MPQPSNSPETWLTLKQAAENLGVHPATLRRWADGGQIAVMITPGGHRRFTATDVDHFAEDRRRLAPAGSLEQLFVQRAWRQTRQEIVLHRHERWLTDFPEKDREQERHLAQRLMGVILQFISLPEADSDTAATLLAEAEAIGRQQAANALALGMALTDALQAAMFFHDALVEAAIHLPETARARPAANLQLLRRLNRLLNTVQLAIAAHYDATNGISLPGS